MAKAKWGIKRICQTCATKFYDFARTPIVCPKCEAVFEPETLLKSRRNRPAAANKVAKPVEEPAVVEEELSEADDLPVAPDDDSDDDTVIADTSDFGEDEDLAKVVVADDDIADA